MIAYLSLSNNGREKAELLKKHGSFRMFGENNYWYSRNIPADMPMVSVHNNVKVATEVYFCTHDVLHDLFNDDPVAMKGGYTNGILNRSSFSITSLSAPEASSCTA